MDRRAFLALTLALAPLPARAQAPQVRRIGILLPSPHNIPLVAPFSKRMGDLGWIESKNLALDVRNAENRNERLPTLATEFIRLKAEVIVTASTPVTVAVKNATSSIPIVFSWVADPVGSGLVASLGRPGGNVTGLSTIADDLAPKQIELLQQLIPNLRTVAVLLDPKFTGLRSMSARLKEAAAQASLSVVEVEASTAEELARAFPTAAGARAGAMVVPPLPLYNMEAERIAQLAKQYRIPTASQFRSFVAAGGLVSYGSDLVDGFLRTAGYVDKILRGAKPADLPVEQADRFETVISRRTAAAFGLTIPQSVLLRAEVIE